MRPRLLPLSAVLLAISFEVVRAQPRPRTFCVVVSQKNAVTDLSFEDTRRIFLGNKTRWPDGRHIIIVLPPQQSAARRFLGQRIVELSDIDFSQRWVGLVFRGEAARAPITARSEQDLRQLIGRSAYGIGLIDCQDLDDSLRVVSIDGKPAGAPGYALQE